MTDKSGWCFQKVSGGEAAMVGLVVLWWWMGVLQVAHNPPGPTPSVDQGPPPAWIHETTADVEGLADDDRGQPVPDPSTVLLVLAGVGVIACSRRFGRRFVTF